MQLSQLVSQSLGFFITINVLIFLSCWFYLVRSWFKFNNCWYVSFCYRSRFWLIPVKWPSGRGGSWLRLITSFKLFYKLNFILFLTYLLYLIYLHIQISKLIFLNFIYSHFNKKLSPFNKKCITSTVICFI